MTSETPKASVFDGLQEKADAADQAKVVPSNVMSFDEAKTLAGDHLVRGIAADGMVRAFAITAKNTVERAHEGHNTSPLVTAALGRLMMGAQMMGAMTKVEDQLISLIIQGDGPIGGLTVTADCNGNVKGYANHPNVWLPTNEAGKLDVGGGIGRGTLTAIFDVPGLEPYSSQVELVSGEIGDDLTSYFVTSDQVPTSVGVGVLVDKDTSVRQAGGFIIQLMPGHPDSLVDQLEENLKDVTSVTTMLEEGMTPAGILDLLLRGMDFRVLETMPVQFHCGCTEARAGAAALALGEVEVEDIIGNGEPIEVYCHFCGKRYELTPEYLRQLLLESLQK